MDCGAQKCNIPWPLEPGDQGTDVGCVCCPVVAEPCLQSEDESGSYLAQL